MLADRRALLTRESGGMPDRDDDLRDWKADVYAAWTQDKEATRRVLSGIFAERDEMDGYQPEHHGGSRIASVSRWKLPFLAGDSDIIHSRLVSTLLDADDPDTKRVDDKRLNNAPPPTIFSETHKNEGALRMTAEQFEMMSPEWIKRTIGIDLVSSAGETFAGPRFKDVSRNGRVLEYSCNPWWFPRNLLITHLNWVDIKDDSVFHRTRLDPGLQGGAGDSLTLLGALRFNPSRGQIENV